MHSWALQGGAIAPVNPAAIAALTQKDPIPR